MDKKIINIINEVEKLKLDTLLEKATDVLNDCGLKDKQTIPTKIIDELKKEDYSSLNEFLNNNKENVEDFCNNKFVKILITYKELEALKDFYNELKSNKKDKSEDIANTLGKEPQ